MAVRHRIRFDDFDQMRVRMFERSQVFSGCVTELWYRLNTTNASEPTSYAGKQTSAAAPRSIIDESKTRRKLAIAKELLKCPRVDCSVTVATPLLGITKGSCAEGNESARSDPVVAVGQSKVRVLHHGCNNAYG